MRLNYIQHMLKCQVLLVEHPLKNDAAVNTIKWTNVPGAESYNVYRSDSQTGNYTLSGNAGDDTYYMDHDVVSGTVYYYKVCAWLGNINGEQSEYKSRRAR